MINRSNWPYFGKLFLVISGNGIVPLILERTVRPVMPFLAVIAWQQHLAQDLLSARHMFLARSLRDPKVRCGAPPAD